DKLLDAFFISVFRTPENKITAPIGDWINIVDQANAYIALGNNKFEFKVGDIHVKAMPDYFNLFMWRSLQLWQIVPDGRDKQMDFTKADYRHFRCRLPILTQL